MDLYLFDFDETLYDYDFRIRLPSLSVLTGVSQYRLAKDWWAAGFEKRAEAGEWSTSEEYLAEFNRQTGARLTLEGWRETRMLASTRIPGSVDALRTAATLGTVGVLTNNPAPFAESFAIMAPDVAELVGENVLVSSGLGVRKPDAEIYRLAMDRFGASPENTFFTDDSASNVAGADAVGIHGYQIEWVKNEPVTDSLLAAVRAFAERA
ncbi:putative hydrolase of the HAD superfamily [Cryobacterium mesophilum]|uniref:HAD family hydrolase n=1 Tax=Terrimesophilobacter mesophilus TaxID=433647 RepID=A0A4R8VF91_9MICO|nr:putative hydrolase of the HAD superfamily [Terrimesophilobacter mesophilus]TFB80892.1 HAD family hydrolase [Terrimesophilobacter mesophilus]